jgi:hypothetical protein
VQGLTQVVKDVEARSPFSQTVFEARAIEISRPMIIITTACVVVVAALLALIRTMQRRPNSFESENGGYSTYVAPSRAP